MKSGTGFDKAKLGVENDIVGNKVINLLKTIHSKTLEKEDNKEISLHLHMEERSPDLGMGTM